MNSIELKAQRYFNWGEDKILNLSIIGNTETLTDIKEILVNSGHTTETNLIETETIEKQIDDINKQVSSMSEEEKLQYVTNLYTEKVKSELAKQGITGDISEYMKQEYQKAPEYQKEVIQNVVEEHETESVETSVSSIADQLLNGTKSKAALPAWLAGFGSVVGWITFRLNYYVWWHVSKVCARQWTGCVAIAMGLLDNGNTLDDIRRKFQNL